MAYDRQAMRIVTPERYARLEQWSQRKPCVALMGEFSAGKSTLLNFLIEEDLLPTRATATELSPVWFSYGTRPCYWEDARGEIHALDPKDLYGVPRSARYIRVFSQAEILEHCDVIDTPGISDPNLAVESWRFAVGVCNMVLWCSSATQAWRESERAAWASLPERLRRHSLLIVTRADKLVALGDKEKVDRRLHRETAGFFADRVFLSTPNAVQAKLEMVEGGASPLWEASGAADLLDRLAERFEGIYEDRAALLGRYATEAMVAEAAEPQIVPTRVRPVEPATARPRPEDVDHDFLASLPTATAMPAAPPAESTAALSATLEPFEATHEAPDTGVAERFEAFWTQPFAAGEEQSAEAEREDRDDGRSYAGEPAEAGTAPDEDNVLRMPMRPVRLTNEERPRTERPSAAEAEELRAALGVELPHGEASAPEGAFAAAERREGAAEAGGDVSEHAAREPEEAAEAAEPFAGYETPSGDFGTWTGEIDADSGRSEASAETEDAAETWSGEAAGPEVDAATFTGTWREEAAHEADAPAEALWTEEAAPGHEPGARAEEVAAEPAADADGWGTEEAAAVHQPDAWPEEAAPIPAAADSGAQPEAPAEPDTGEWGGEPAEDPVTAGEGMLDWGLQAETEAVEEILADDGEMNRAGEDAALDAPPEEVGEAAGDEAPGPADAEAEAAPEAAAPALRWVAEDVTPAEEHGSGAGDDAGPGSEPEPSVEEVAEMDVWAVGDFAPPVLELEGTAHSVEAEQPEAFEPADDNVEAAAEAVAELSQETVAALHDEATLRAVEEAMGEEDLTRTLILTAEHSVGEVVDAAPQVPHEVLVWREIVARHELDPANAQMVAMFDEFLTALYGTSPDPTAAAADGGRIEAHGAGGWRRLA